MSKLSKLSTIFIAALPFVFAAAGCTAPSQQMAIAPGAEGTFVALASDIDGSVSAGGTRFDFAHSKAKGLSIASAAGVSGYDSNESKQFMPASITKLVTTSLALKALGPEFKFSTRVYWTAEGSTARDLVIVADGDPQVVRNATGAAQQEVFAKIAQGLKQSGITRIEGGLKLISADERHDYAIPAAGMEDSDHTTCFGAISQSFNFGWNCGVLRIGSSIGWADTSLQFPLESSVTDGSTSVTVTPLYENSGRVAKFSLSGSVDSATDVSLPISDVKPWYGRALQAYLTSSGVDASGATLEMPRGEGARAALEKLNGVATSFEIPSESLSAIVQYTNKPSDNFFADAIFKTIASHHGSGGDLRAEGQAAVRDAIHSWLAADGHDDYASDIQLVDGAGLSHNNYVTPRAYLSLLRQFTHEKWFAYLYNSLPIAGQDGTLKERMKGSVVQGRVHAKTGTLRGYYQLAGYVPKMAADGSVAEYIPFVILSNVDAGKRWNVFDFQTQLASSIYNLVNP